MSAPPPSPPPTIIVVHPHEKRSKCSVEPLRGRPGFVFLRHPVRTPPPELTPAAYVRLGLGGPLLGPADADRGLLILDATWRWAAHMERAFADYPVRSLPPAVTAYPRTSKVRADPAEGLATIEALYLAYVQLGRPVAGLLDHYHWGARFLELNGLS